MNHDGSAHEWSTFSVADLTTPAAMLKSLPASDEVVLVVEAERDWVRGHGTRRRDHKHPFTATIWRANGYGAPEMWRLHLTFPEIATRRSLVIPVGGAVTHVGKTDADLVIPATLTARDMIGFVIEAMCGLADRPDTGVWRARIPSFGGRNQRYGRPSAR